MVGVTFLMANLLRHVWSCYLLSSLIYRTFSHIEIDSLTNLFSCHIDMISRQSKECKTGVICFRSRIQVLTWTADLCISCRRVITKYTKITYIVLHSFLPAPSRIDWTKAKHVIKYANITQLRTVTSVLEIQYYKSIIVKNDTC